jgi:hypothetical protein
MCLRFFRFHICLQAYCPNFFSLTQEESILPEAKFNMSIHCQQDAFNCKESYSAENSKVSTSFCFCDFIGTHEIKCFIKLARRRFCNPDTCRCCSSVLSATLHESLDSCTCIAPRSRDPAPGILMLQMRGTHLFHTSG